MMFNPALGVPCANLLPRRLSRNPSCIRRAKPARCIQEGTDLSLPRPTANTVVLCGNAAIGSKQGATCIEMCQAAMNSFAAQSPMVSMTTTWQLTVASGGSESYRLDCPQTMDLVHPCSSWKQVVPAWLPLFNFSHVWLHVSRKYLYRFLGGVAFSWQAWCLGNPWLHFAWQAQSACCFCTKRVGSAASIVLCSKIYTFSHRRFRARRFEHFPRSSRK